MRFLRFLVFFAAFTAFFLRFAIAALLAISIWRVSHQCGRESTRTAFHLLQHNEKSSVPLKEVCMEARKVHALQRATTSRGNAIAFHNA